MAAAHLSLEELSLEVKSIRADQVSASSRYSYLMSNVKMIMWFRNEKSHLLSDWFLSGFPADSEGKAAQAAYIKAAISLDAADEHHCPLKYEEIVALDYLQWLTSLRKSSGEKVCGFKISINRQVCHSTINSHRSAITFLHKMFMGRGMDDATGTAFAGFFRGIKRRSAKDVAGGAGPVHTGKSPMVFAMYRWLAETMLSLGTVEGLFGFCMLTMSWNLLCRVSNAAGICISHLEWREDALGVFFAHMKNDQTGERPRDPRHVYANPLMPDICPILALGIYLLCCPTKSGHLFPGKNQDDRYSKLIKRLFLAHPEKMTEFGITANVSVQILKQD